MRQRPESGSDREGVGEDVLGDGIGLVLEPLYAAEDEECSRKCGEGTCNQNATLGAQQPERGRDHHEDAEPCDLARCAAEGIGGNGETYPGDGSA